MIYHAKNWGIQFWAKPDVFKIWPAVSGFMSPVKSLTIVKFIEMAISPCLMSQSLLLVQLCYSPVSNLKIPRWCPQLFLASYSWGSWTCKFRQPFAGSECLGESEIWAKPSHQFPQHLMPRISHLLTDECFDEYLVGIGVCKPHMSWYLKIGWLGWA